VIHIKGDRLLSDLRDLASIGKFQTGVDRVAFSAADIEARRWLVAKLQAAGLDASMDQVGNVLGRYPNVASAVLVGSHTDTVPKGGWLDGALGVVYGLEIARSAIEAGERLTTGIDVVSFQDEEGTFLPFLGSRSFCADVTEAELAHCRSRDGTRLTQALATIAHEAPPLRLDVPHHLCFLEAHIEQGPRLEAAGRRIGVVSAIVGIRRFRIRTLGRADHAGTTPMAARSDAGAELITLAAWVGEEFSRLAGPDTVWNIGQIEFRPGAANVVPVEAELLLEFRDPRQDTLDAIESRLLERVSAPKGRSCKIEAEQLVRIPPTAMASDLRELIATAATAAGEQPLLMPSGAGHDAMVLARFIPAAMMFVPSIGGRSHDVTENTSDLDIVRGCEVLAAAVSELRRKFSGGHAS
jgi:beta-ureidopropionase / N-carbamoyl-L-amino-acid hydrolase